MNSNTAIPPLPPPPIAPPGTASATPAEPPQVTTRSTTAARVAASSGPAAATAEACKNRKKRMISLTTPSPSGRHGASDPSSHDSIARTSPHHNDTGCPYGSHQTGLPRHPNSQPVPPPQNWGAHHHHLRCQSSRTRAPPPPQLLPPVDTHKPSQTPPQQTDATLDISMDPEEIPEVFSIPALNPLSLRAWLEAAAGRQPSLSGKLAPRNPIDKYTKSPSEGMPLVHAANPTAALEFIDLDLISTWEQAEGEKLLAHPFNNEAKSPELHENIKTRILTAIAEITGSQTVGVSAPKPSEDAIKKRCTPTAFLIYNLTLEQQTLLLRRRVWSSLAITFHVTDLSPQCPGFIFSIKGFSTLIDTGIWDIVERVWSDDQTHAFIATLTGTLPDDVRQEAYRSAHAFLASLHISHLDVRDAGDTLDSDSNKKVEEMNDFARIR
ncbi:hypothetical protein EDB87DRAFT_1582586 [Lactarius vividus]|nr:hypothetical protein EDB87DRAFT_1582586 [Lactarius vividus]